MVKASKGQLQVDLDEAKNEITALKRSGLYSHNGPKLSQDAESASVDILVNEIDEDEPTTPIPGEKTKTPAGTKLTNNNPQCSYKINTMNQYGDSPIGIDGLDCLINLANIGITDKTPIIEGTSKSDYLNGTNGTEIIQGKQGNDTLNGILGPDRLLYKTKLRVQGC